MAVAAVIGAAIGCFILVDVVVVWPFIVAGRSDFVRYLEAARTVLGGTSPYALYDFDYPALIAILVVPLAPLTTAVAHVVWYFLNIILYATSGVLVWRLLGQGRSGAFAVVLVWGFGGEVAESLALGQLNFALLILILVWWGAAGARPARRSIGLGLATGLKLWPAALLAPHLLAGNQRLASKAIGAAAVFLLGPWVWVQLCLAGSAHPGSAWYWAGNPSVFNFSLPGVILRLLDRPEGGARLPRAWIVGNSPSLLKISPSDQAIGVVVGGCVLAAGLMWLVLQARAQRVRIDDPLVHAACLSLVLASAPMVWHHYHVLQLPAVALLLHRAIEHRAWRRGVAAVAVGLGLTWIHGLGLRPYLAGFGWSGAHIALLWFLTSLPAALSLLLGAMLMREAREHEREGNAPQGELTREIPVL